MKKETFNKDKEFMANIFANESYDDVNVVNEDNIVVRYMSDEGEALLFKDGSLLKYTDDYATSFSIVKPNHELEVGILSDEDAGLYILDHRYNDLIGNRDFNSNLRKLMYYPDEKPYLSLTDPDFNEEGLSLNDEFKKNYFKEIGLDELELNKAAKEVHKNHMKPEMKGEISNIFKKLKEKTKGIFGNDPIENNKNRNKNRNK